VGPLRGSARPPHLGLAAGRQPLRLPAGRHALSPRLPPDTRTIAQAHAPRGGPPRGVDRQGSAWAQFSDLQIEVDKASGATLDVIPLPGVKTGGGFAFFGGDFYFFTDSMSDGKSEVTHIDHDDSDKNGLQDLKVIYQDAPLRIVGAGVSTCAPPIPQ